MARKLKTDIPGPDWRRSFEAAAEEGVASLFRPELSAPRALVLEIGFGRGEFLLALAEKQPATAFLAVETSRKRVLKMARRLARTPHRNVRLLEARGEQVVAELLPDASLSACWINFPDPWPKKRHHKRRLLQAPFVAQLAGRLAPGASLYVATDHVEYAEQIHEVLSKQPVLENAYAPSAWLREVPGRMPTAYELEWRSEGRPLHFFAYRRPADAPRRGEALQP
jgi:tRNA (guanine-N7-)-methyltransferase